MSKPHSFATRFALQFRNIWKFLCSRVFNTDFTVAIGRCRIPHDALRRGYHASPLHDEPDTFVLYRVIGNDLPPRHRTGQTLDNLKFLLEHEPALPGCEKRWVVNRILDPTTEAAILALLREHGQPVLHLPFVASEYSRVGYDIDVLPRPDFLGGGEFSSYSPVDQRRLLMAVYRHKNNYVMNNNGARNAALAEGRGLAKWVLPFDGNCFFTTRAWSRLTSSVKASPWLRHFVVPMARLLDNQPLLDKPDFEPPAKEEPQLVFRRDAVARFNEVFPYGRRPKVELFWHLGIPGRWDYWPEAFWDQPARPLSDEACQFGLAGWVARLYSGNSTVEKDLQRGPTQRGEARGEAILSILSHLDRSLGLENPPGLDVQSMFTSKENRAGEGGGGGKHGEP